MDERLRTPGILVSYLLWGLLLLGLFLTSRYSYLLFHNLTGFFSVIIATGVFAIAWNARRFQENNYLLFLGIAYLFVGALDLLYTLSYQGMEIFPGSSAHLPTELWFAARCLESVSLFLAPQYIGRPLRPYVVFGGYLALFAAIILVVFIWRPDPLNLLPSGPVWTALKKTGHYVNCVMLLGAMILLWRQREEFAPEILNLLLWAIALAIGSDVTLTFIAGISAQAGLVGYLFKIVSFYLIYRALIAAELIKPYNRLFNNLRLTGEAVRHEKDFTDRLMEMAQVIVLVLDGEGRILRLNQACEAITGYSLAAVKNRPFWEVFPAPEEVEAVQEAFFDLIAGDFSQSWQIDWVAKDGSRRLIAWSNTAFLREDGSVEYVIGTGIDISEHREVEKRLQRLNGKLEHQIQAEPRFAWELPVAGWERGSYNAAVFHDFRVPLRWLSGYCRALEQCSAGRLDRKGRKYLHRLRRMIQQMEDFIEVSRQQARLTRTGMYHQKTNLSAQARIIAAGLKRTSPARQVEFIIEKDLIATGDPIMLRAVLQNLLGNAWRFTEEVPRGRIEFGAWHPKNCSSGFFVRDNRTDFGIPSGPKLFRSFQRLQTIRDFSGSDLSLAAVRRIILRHGGRIWAEGAMGQGVTFYFTLPNPPPVIDQDTATGDQPNPRTG